MGHFNFPDVITILERMEEGVRVERETGEVEVGRKEEEAEGKIWKKKVAERMFEKEQHSMPQDV